MKKIFKTVPVLLATSFVLASACACTNGVSDLRRRERQMQERQRQEQEEQLLEQEQNPEEELDPDFSVDPVCPGCPEKPHRPHRPHSEDPPQNPIFPDHGHIQPRYGEPVDKPKPVPFPLPHN